jgi:HipA-like protein
MPRGRRSPLKVVMNGQLVGRLHAAPRGLLTFSYAESWLSSEVGRPISLSMPLAGRQFSGHVVENFFDNLLPDNQPIRGRLQARVGAESSRCFDLLTHIGRDCVGALQLLPEDEDADVRCIRATPLSAQVIETISGIKRGQYIILSLLFYILSPFLLQAAPSHGNGSARKQPPLPLGYYIKKALADNSRRLPFSQGGDVTYY